MSKSLHWMKNLFATMFVVGVLAVIVFFLCNHFLYLNSPISTNMNACVLIGAEGASGSGVVFRNGERVFIWTCQHVIASNIHHSVKIDMQKKKLDYDRFTTRVHIKSKIFNADLAESGYINIWADVLRFSAEDDLAVLEVLEPRVFKQSVEFPRNKKFIPGIGTQVFHIGSMLGWHGFNGCSDGIMGLPGIDIDESGKVYDKVQCSFHFGSSGGGVFEATSGQCIGLVARSNDRTAMTQGYIIPYRRMVEFAQRLDCTWALSDHEVPECYKDRLTDDALYADLDAFIKEMRKNSK